MTSPDVVFFDIDGTLLTTGRAGIGAWVDAAHEVTGTEVNLSDMATSGLTDRMIARAILEMTGVNPNDDLEASMWEVYARELPRRLLDRRGGVLPGVVALIEALGHRRNTLVALLTGNLRASATAKLQSYGLAQYFDLGGFADDGYERTEIGRAALHRVSEAVGGLDLDRVFLTGDSPYDVACAAALGVRGIAVATGQHTLSELMDDSPWWGLDCLPAPEVFIERLEKKE